VIPLFKVALAADALDRVAEVFRSGYLGHGPLVERFEHELADRLGNPYVATVNNATSGLHLAMRLVTDPGPAGDKAPEDRDEVLSTPLTFEATNWAIRANGLRIRWVDVDPATLNIDLADLERKLSPRTRAVSVVHWAGYPVDLDRLRGILDRAEAAYGYRPPVVEDCAHAWGATYRGKLVGNHGNTCVFSFQAIKHLTCGDGGLIVGADAETHRRARLLRWLGIDRAADRVRADYDVPEWGFNFHLNEIGAAIGLANLSLVDGLVARHRENAAVLDAELAGVPGLERTARSPDREPSFWMYPVKVDDRPAFTRKMADAGIAVSVMVRRNDAHSCARDFATPLPGMDSVQDRMVHLPVGWWLSEEDISYIVKAVTSGW